MRDGAAIRSMRARLLLALVATSAVTLLAAAAALLSPLQTRLRDQSRTALRAAVLSARGQLVDGLREGHPDPREITRRLAVRTNSVGQLFDLDPRLSGPPLNDGLPKTNRPPEVQTLYEQRRSNTVVSQDGNGIRITVGLLMPARNGHFYVLSVEKQDANIVQIVSEVRRAFITAALIGLAVALGLGLVLSRTLNRRLARLRQAARRIVEEGPDVPELVDPRRDELGDLARAMAEMQEALRRQESARRRFVATASHELRTPLTSAMGTLELLAEDLDADDLDIESAQEQVRLAQADLQRLRTLATELLDLSRLDAGVELRQEPVELGEVARAVAAEFALQAAAGDQTLDVVAPRSACWCRGDPGAVARIARILIDNALRYAPPGSTIAIAAGHDGEHAQLEVCDEGPGVAPADRELIFERFRRGASAAPGFGLGLAIGRELAVRQGGSLELDERHAPGARFVLRLQIELPRGGQPEASPESGSRSYSVDGVVR
jgi:signal transduction histidine kinase